VAFDSESAAEYKSALAVAASRAERRRIETCGMGRAGMTYIYCRRYSEAKSVLICAVRCPYALGCRDWAGALAGDQRERIEQEVQAYAHAKGIAIAPEIWQPLSVKRKRRASLRSGNASSSPAPLSPSGAEGVPSPACDSGLRNTEGGRMGEEKSGEGKRAVARSGAREVASQPATRRKGAEASPRRRRQKEPGTIFLILERNGRYREVKSEEEMKRIAIESAGRNRKGVRFARATLLEVDITFRPVR
jgi:hypothetical protein